MSIKQRVVWFVMKHMAYSVVDEDVLNVKEMTPETKSQLAFEASTVEGTLLWKQLLGEMDNVSKFNMFMKGKNEQDLIFGKACLFVCDIMRRKVAKLSASGKKKS